MSSAQQPSCRQRKWDSSCGNWLARSSGKTLARVLVRAQWEGLLADLLSQHRARGREKHRDGRASGLDLGDAVEEFGSRM